MRQVPALALCFWLQGFGAASADGLAPLTGQPGDPARGEALLLDMRRVSCLICHEISTLDERDQGQIGPALDGVASRLGNMELRQRIVDARVINPDTIMPPYYSLTGLVDVADRYRGQTIYDAQEVEDVVAYLLTLTEEPNR
ncbi:MAG: sulfur oxidation c-type cytochrome SoxX [Boseongicola sp.]|nr:sulfur oxidation c-type cytochrome SoxX [Boseongicola sp.]